MKEGQGATGRDARLPVLDLLRAVAILLVLFNHHFFATILMRIGRIGVDLFFVLSGFLISGLLFAELNATGGIRVGRFLLRRGFKIYPSFYVFLAASMTFYDRNPLGVVTEALFIQNYASLTGSRIWYHTWSLAVEEHFYLVLPFVLAIAARSRRLSINAVVGAFFMVAVVCAGLRALNCATNPLITIATHYEATHLRIDSLFFGVVLGYLNEFHHVSLAGAVGRHRWILSWVAAILLLPVFIIPATNAWMNILGLPGLYVAFGIVLVLALFAAPLPAFAQGSWLGRELLRIGRDSYNIYLWHAFVLAVLAPLWRSKTADIPLVGTGRGDFLIYFVTSILLGHLATGLIERPMLKLRDRLVPRRA